jgi:hypothetical protein
MSMGHDNQVDWAAAAIPAGDGVARGRSHAAKPRAAPTPPRNVMDTLLGDTELTSSFDPGGNDPYNATGRQFRR